LGSGLTLRYGTVAQHSQDFASLIVSDFGAVVLFAAMNAVPSFAHLVITIVLRSTKKEMLGITARRIVAMVADKHFTWVFFVMKLKRKAVRRKTLTIKLDGTITTRSSCTHIRPTRIWSAIVVNEIPETLRGHALADSSTFVRTIFRGFSAGCIRPRSEFLPTNFTAESIRDSSASIEARQRTELSGLLSIPWDVEPRQTLLARKPDSIFFHASIIPAMWQN